MKRYSNSKEFRITCTHEIRTFIFFVRMFAYIMFEIPLINIYAAQFSYRIEIILPDSSFEFHNQTRIPKIILVNIF